MMTTAIIVGTPTQKTIGGWQEQHLDPDRGDEPQQVQARGARSQGEGDQGCGVDDVGAATGAQRNDDQPQSADRDVDGYRQPPVPIDRGVEREVER